MPKKLLLNYENSSLKATIGYELQSFVKLVGWLGKWRDSETSSLARSFRGSWCARKCRGLHQILVYPFLHYIHLYSMNILLKFFYWQFQRRLGKWKYKSSTQAINESVMFPLKVTKELVHWPEMSARQRKWVSLCIN